MIFSSEELFKESKWRKPWVFGHS